MSGGQDSATCLYWALREYDEVQTITFDYGQNHAAEIQCSKNICENAGVKQTIVNIEFLSTLVDSALVSTGDVNATNTIGLPSTFVPNRNQLFITIAHTLAFKLGYDKLVTGVCQTDYSGYPDCRHEFISNLEEVMNYGAGLDGTQHYIEIDTPLMFLTKAATFKLAEQLGCLDIVINETLTCYKGDTETKNDWGQGCGECPACVLRLNGYKEFKKLK